MRGWGMFVAGLVIGTVGQALAFVVVLPPAEVRAARACEAELQQLEHECTRCLVLEAKRLRDARGR